MGREFWEDFSFNELSVIGLNLIISKVNSNTATREQLRTLKDLVTRAGKLRAKVMYNKQTPSV